MVVVALIAGGAAPMADLVRVAGICAPAGLRRATSTIRLPAGAQYNSDGKSAGVIWPGSRGVGVGVCSASTPNIDQVSLTPFQLRNES